MYLPNDMVLKKREREIAIAASLIAAYCTFVLLIIFELPNFTNDKQFELATTVIIAFSWIIGVIIVFYFSSRSFDKWVDSKNEIDKKRIESEKKIDELKIEHGIKNGEGTGSTEDHSGGEEN